MTRTDEQTKEWVEKRYASPDPWGYQTNADDAFRKAKVLAACNLLAPHPGAFARALDVGAGEGWITAGLPALERFGLELSDAAAARFPEGVGRVSETSLRDGSFDLVVSTETMFEHYDWKAIRDCILRAAAPGGTIVTANNAKWEVKALEEALGRPMLRWDFPYKGMTMSVKAWRRDSAAGEAGPDL